MKQLRVHTKIVIAGLLLLAGEFAFGAITGRSDGSKDKYSLSHLNSSNQRIYSLSSLRTNSFRYSGSSDIYHLSTGDQIQVQSMIRMERGNTTYVYPYKYTVKVPKFQTPQAPFIR